MTSRMLLKVLFTAAVLCMLPLTVKAEKIFAWPVATNYSITNGFTNSDPNAGHSGADLPTPTGTAVYAPSAGTISYYYVTSNGKISSYGNFIDLDTGSYVLRFCHLSSFTNGVETPAGNARTGISGGTRHTIKTGVAVSAGELIGYTGEAGNATGPHLHLEILQNGTRMNPALWFNQSLYAKDLWVDPVIHGAYMETGYERVIPDGNYYILSAADPSFFLDIDGVDIPAAAGTNVHLYHTDTGYIGAADVWTVKYSDGFCQISQMNTGISLDVEEASDVQGCNVEVWTSNGTSAQQWAISYNGDQGYRLQARCSGFSLDINGGTLSIGQNIQQWSGNDTNAQRWLFIPYQPVQPVAEGRYILTSVSNQAFELDVPGNTGDVADNTVMQIWEDSGCLSQYNAFDVRKLSNGYYTLTNVVSGKALAALNGSSINGTKAVVCAPDGSTSQEWAITEDGGSGKYILRARSSGLCLDVDNNVMENGRTVLQWPYKGSVNQRWQFVPAEHTVTYFVNGGEGEIAPQTKYYKASLTLTADIPSREGYIFQGWSTTPSGSIRLIQPGELYGIDENLDLYAVWLKETKLILPESLAEIGEESFTGTNAVTVMIPESCIRIGKSAFANCPHLYKVYLPRNLESIDKSAFAGCDNVVLYVYKDTLPEWYAKTYNLKYEVIEG